jgi:hypothetical protein
MSSLLLAAIALVTYGSRVAALALLPRPGPRIEAVLSRMPAPIFAGLATVTLVTGDGALVGGPILGAAIGALLATPARSLLACLLAGGAGYAVAALAG